MWRYQRGRYGKSKASEGKRQLPTGEIMKISANKDRRKLHKSILAEQAQQRGLEQSER